MWCLLPVLHIILTTLVEEVCWFVLSVACKSDLESFIQRVSAFLSLSCFFSKTVQINSFSWAYLLC